MPKIISMLQGVGTEEISHVELIGTTLSQLQGKMLMPFEAGNSDSAGCRGSPAALRLKSPMQLGAFSISLTVKDISASAACYEKLGFTSFGGDITQNWLILKNGETVIGLFQGMFEKNMLTFNPGWSQNAEALDSFTDVRDLQRELKAQGAEFVSEADEADEATTCPGSFIVVDPDGNPVLVDQHV
ncbi:UNVERIFIED_ORG: putative lactoylglutathione lyase [Arthrobacter sp. UYCu721]